MKHDETAPKGATRNSVIEEATSNRKTGTNETLSSGPLLAQENDDDTELIEDDVKTLNDAVVLGETSSEYEAMLDRVIKLTVGRHGKQKSWSTAETTWREAIIGGEDGGFSRHRETKKKGGLCCVLVELAGKRRQADAVVKFHALGLDFDSGTYRADVEAKIKALGFAAIVYDSYNNQKAESDIKRSVFFGKMKRADSKICTASVQEYLKHYAPSISTVGHIASVELIDERCATDEGLVIRYRHAPIDKFRVILPLAQSIDAEEISLDFNTRKNVWAGKIIGAGFSLLGGHMDTACTDLNRVHYMPEHPKGASPSIKIFQGRPITFDEIPTMEKSTYVGRFRKGHAPSDDAKGLLMSCGTPWVRWAATHASRLQLATLIETEFPDLIRNNKGSLLEIECPLEDNHSSKGGTGTHVKDSDGMGGGFQFGCKHSCPDDRLLLLHELVKSQPDFDESWLWNDFHNGGYCWPDDDEEEYLADAPMPSATKPSVRASSEHASPDNTPVLKESDSEFEPRSVWLGAAYKVNNGDLVKKGSKKDDENDLRICQVFDVVGRSSNADGTASAGRIISFKNENGKVVEHTISLADIMTDGNAVVRKLCDAGLIIYGRKKTAIDAFLDLLKSITPQRQIPTVDTPGWVRDEFGIEVGFVLPSGVFVSGGETGPIRLLEGSRVSYPRPRGSEDAYTAAVVEALKYSDTNFYWALSIVAGFSGPILGLLKERSCGFVLSGHSSLGKTLGQQLGAAAFASPEDGDGLLHSAKTTPNAIEDLCVMTTHTTFMFDEIGMFQNKRHLESILFGMSGGVSKARKKDRNVGLAQRTKYNPFVVMSSEFGIKQEIENGGGKYRAGLVARFPDIDVSGGIKVDKQSRDVMELALQNYGHAGPKFVRHIIESGIAANRPKLTSEVDAIILELTKAKGPVIARAAKPFAIAQRAGEIAADAGILGEDVSGAKVAVQTAILKAWTIFTESDEAGAASSDDAMLETISAKLNGLWNRTIIEAGAENGGGEADGAEARGTPLGWYDEHFIYLDWVQLEDPAAALGIPIKRAKLVKVLGGAVDRKSEREAPKTRLPAHVATAASGDGRSVKNLKLRRDALGM